ncbi:MAG: hypothetical protein V4451_04750 [Pseudomonadota bacterium]
MKKDETVTITVRMPKPLAKQLDTSAAQQTRSRSAELIVRLAQTFPRGTRQRSAAR